MSANKERGKTTREARLPPDASVRQVDFSQFQLKEYENISQAHFKTNEVHLTFYRYFTLITVVPITTLIVAIVTSLDSDTTEEARLVSQFLFGSFSIVLSLVGSAMILYIEGLRLDAIIYARTVNSIRSYFLDRDPDDPRFLAILPTMTDKPEFGGFGAALIMFLGCALINSCIMGLGTFAFQIDKSVALNLAAENAFAVRVSLAALAASFVLQLVVRHVLICQKETKFGQ